MHNNLKCFVLAGNECCEVSVLTVDVTKTKKFFSRKEKLLHTLSQSGPGTAHKTSGKAAKAQENTEKSLKTFDHDYLKGLKESFCVPDPHMMFMLKYIVFSMLFCTI